MNLDVLKKWITRWEGVRYVAYDDGTGKPITAETLLKGKPHIGVGFNLSAGGAEAIVEGIGLDYQAVCKGEVKITPEQVDQLLDATIAVATKEAKKLFPALDTYPEDQQLIVADLVFNMGEGALATRFPKTVLAIKAQDWPAASAALKDSHWFTQVGAKPTQRGGEDVAILGGTVTVASVLAPKKS